MGQLMWAVLCASALVGSSLALGQGPKPRTEAEIQKDLDKARMRVKELEEELLKVVPVEVQNLPDETFTLGAVYRLTMSSRQGVVAVAVKVRRVLGDTELLAIFEHDNGRYPQEFLLQMPTKGIADGSYITRDTLKYAWKLSGTKKVGAATVYVLKQLPYPRPKKE